MRREYAATIRKGSTYFGSVAFFKHIIYICLIAVILTGLYGIYLLLDNILFDHIRDFIDSTKGIFQHQTYQEDKPGTQIDLNIENRNHGSYEETVNSVQTNPVNEQKSSWNGKTDTWNGNADSWNGETAKWNGLEKLGKDGINNDAEEDYLPEKTNSAIDYQQKYPELYSKPSNGFVHREKVAYLTFDDGPSSRTLEVLKILKEYDIKATFFVVTSNTNISLLEKIAEEGHTIGIHTNSHVYKEIYSSVEAFLDDFNTAYQVVLKETGIKPEIFRFPGGSLNAHNMGTYQEIISEMLRRGFIYYDWNISTNDSDPKLKAKDMVKIIKDSVKGQDKLVVLCHDSHHKYETVKALPEIIEFLQSQGYSFDKLDNTVEPVVFTYR
ncbi:MAG: polysaccharide deacetylase [Clostridiales bacterium]|jgi:peptidoglycan/xylan/chitin deacetylase (PgdA/CDA1 family)|nr:polysaccharide deacetylase [Clostridiales bacterium]